MEYFVCVLSFILSISSPSCSSVAISLIFRRTPEATASLWLRGYFKTAEVVPYTGPPLEATVPLCTRGYFKATEVVPYTGPPPGGHGEFAHAFLF